MEYLSKITDNVEINLPMLAIEYPSANFKLTYFEITSWVISLNLKSL